MTSITGSAPGRLDLLGGVADYSGALVLEVATAAHDHRASPKPADAFVVGPVQLSVDEIAALAQLPYPEIRVRARAAAALDALRARRRAGARPPRRDRTAACQPLRVVRRAAVGRGVVERGAGGRDGTRALGADGIDPLRLASLCQEAENHVVGAPCGIMDQVVVAMGRRRRGASDPLPTGVGATAGRRCPTASRWSGGRRAPSTTSAVRPTAGPAPPRSWASASSRSEAARHVAVGEHAARESAVDELPETLDGAAFLDRWGTTDDDVTTVDPDRDLPGRGGDEIRRRGAPAERGRTRCDSTAVTPPRSVR